MYSMDLRWRQCGFMRGNVGRNLILAVNGSDPPEDELPTGRMVRLPENKHFVSNPTTFHRPIPSFRAPPTPSSSITYIHKWPLPCEMEILDKINLFIFNEHIKQPLKCRIEDRENNIIITRSWPFEWLLHYLAINFTGTDICSNE